MTVYDTQTKESNSTNYSFNENDIKDKTFVDFETCLSLEEENYELKINNETYNIFINENGKWSLGYDSISLKSTEENETKLKYERNGMNLKVKSGIYEITFRFTPVNKII